RSIQLSEEQRDRVADTLRLAQGLEGEAVSIPGGARRVADDVIAYAQANNVTHIIIGKSSRSRWFEILYGSVVHELVRSSGNISVHVIAGDELGKESIPRKTVQAAAQPDTWIGVPLLGAVAAVAIALGVGALLRPWLGVETIDLLFLTAIVGVALRF